MVRIVPIGQGWLILKIKSLLHRKKGNTVDDIEENMNKDNQKTIGSSTPTVNISQQKLLEFDKRIADMENKLSFFSVKNRDFYLNVLRAVNPLITQKTRDDINNIIIRKPELPFTQTVFPSEIEPESIEVAEIKPRKIGTGTKNKRIGKRRHKR